MRHSGANDVGDITNADGKFTSRLRALPEEYREMYAAVSERLLLYHGVRARVTDVDTYLYGHRAIAKMDISDKRLILYLSNAGKPLEVIIDTNMQLVNALSLIDGLMAKLTNQH